MPIASPPTTYQLDRPGCSGIAYACGPYLSICDPRDLECELLVARQVLYRSVGFPLSRVMKFPPILPFLWTRPGSPAKAGLILVIWVTWIQMGESS